MFKNLVWQKDRLIINNLVFRIEQINSDNWKENDEYFIFYKLKTLVDQYESYFKSNPLSKPIKNMIEIGMWDGGSAAFWNEILCPEKLIGIDLLDTGGGKYFNKYLENLSKENNNKIVPYWSTNQSDKIKLKSIITENFGKDAIDLVFDDGSHWYQPTLDSFNTIFPYLATGSLYIIEDWAWAHWKGFETHYPPNTELSKLILELVQASANTGLIESLTVYQGFVVIKKGNLELKNDFDLKKYIYNIPKRNKFLYNLKNFNFRGYARKVRQKIS
jgi:Methyltransferase domain